MISLRSILVAAFLATANLAAAQTTTTASGVEQPTKVPTLGTDTVHGCYSSGGELELNSTIKFNSQGECNTVCRAANKAVAGSTAGNQCYCGDKYPPTDTLVEDTQCNIPCPGFGPEACGGLKTFTIYNTGLVLAVEDSTDTKASSSASAGASSTSTSSPAIVTVSGTVVVTSSPNSDAEKSSSGGSNTVGIAAGVVVGVVAIAGIAGGIFFWRRHQRNREIEDEHRRNAAVNAFISGSKPPGSSGGISMTDSRLDPVLANRRLSTGSIADNEDYSRRILRVTNA